MPCTLRHAPCTHLPYNRVTDASGLTLPGCRAADNLLGVEKFLRGRHAHEEGEAEHLTVSQLTPLYILPPCPDFFGPFRLNISIYNPSFFFGRKSVFFFQSHFHFSVCFVFGGGRCTALTAEMKRKREREESCRPKPRPSSFDKVVGIDDCIKPF